MARFYISEISIIDIFSTQNKTISLKPQGSGFEFYNLIITGPNGSGKTTLLESISSELYKLKAKIPNHRISDEIRSQLNKYKKVDIKFNARDNDLLQWFSNQTLTYIRTSRSFSGISANQTINNEVKISNWDNLVNDYSKKLHEINQVVSNAKVDLDRLEKNLKNSEEVIKKVESEIERTPEGSEKEILFSRYYSHLQKHQQIQYDISTRQRVKSQNEDRIQKFCPELYAALEIKNYILKLSQQIAMYRQDEQHETAAILQKRLDKVKNGLEKILHEQNSKLIIELIKGRVYFLFSDGRTVEFEQLSNGYDSLLLIYAEILLLVHESQDPFHYSHKGIVVIDEIDAHLHPSLQETVFQVLTESFPEIQFIISTHSPFLIRSLENPNTKIVRLPDCELLEQSFNYWNIDDISELIFQVNSGWSKKTEHIINEFQKLVVEDSNASLIFQKFQELCSKSPSVKSMCNRIIAIYGSTEVRDMVLANETSR